MDMLKIRPKMAAMQISLKTVGSSIIDGLNRCGQRSMIPMSTSSSTIRIEADNIDVKLRIFQVGLMIMHGMKMEDRPIIKRPNFLEPYSSLMSNSGNSFLNM